jgi:hypothetical protein
MAASLLIEKIKFYRNVLYVFYFFNVLSVISGIVLSVSIYKKMDHLESELVITSIASILFGIVLPYYLIVRIKRKVFLLQKEVENQIRVWVKGWFDTYKQYGDDSFQNSEFWLKIVMLSVEQLAQYSTHPALYMGAQISQIVRQELDKKRSAATA